MFQSTGYGYKVNLSNTIGFIESEFGIHITGTNFLIIAVLLINSLLVLIKKNMPQWKCIALLALITILVPGFSYTYTIMFMLIPFFYFLGSEHDQKWDCYYLILFMLMFVLLPIKNQFGGLEAINMDAVYPLGWTTIVETVVLLSHKKADSYIHIDVEFGEGEGKIPVDSIAKRAEAYKPKEKVTYKMIKEYIEAKYGFKVHTAYIAEVKRDLGLPMYDAPNAVEELKQPRKHPTPEKVEAIKDALRYFAVI